MHGMSNPRIYGVRADREVRRTRAYGFGHYDSRGGYTLIESATMREALQEYAEETGINDTIPEEWQEGDRKERTMGDEAAEADLDWGGLVILCDGEPEPGELLEQYDGPGWRIGRVECLMDGGAREGWQEAGWRVIWKGEPPTLRYEQQELPISPGKVELRINEETEEIGEDAFGVVWVPVTARMGHEG